MRCGLTKSVPRCSSSLRSFGQLPTSHHPKPRSSGSKTKALFGTPGSFPPTWEYSLARKKWEWKETSTLALPQGQLTTSCFTKAYDIITRIQCQSLMQTSTEQKHILKKIIYHNFYNMIVLFGVQVAWLKWINYPQSYRIGPSPTTTRATFHLGPRPLSIFPIFLPALQHSFYPCHII